MDTARVDLYRREVRRWLEAWRDLRELQGAGAFALLTREAMLAELCRALLRGGHFSLAQSYLQVDVPCACCGCEDGHGNQVRTRRLQDDAHLCLDS